ncbi:cytochrome O ubiquinol oxidase subunit III [Candidatus Carsonella ruddii HT isolate Thao2000]|uniref:Cytochrome O ubiquinol oxidase subunit III n=1 Tax=Candidatus Carsonella ruddii HT isolate Thao2000 TaxID=1202539 RepID=J3TWE7_CARRU|nr:hypothetical protein [Candidatus Carsonella ruddii]AFP84215.1 cytochrome O ubiquinol oxidase subunit III [Candidatus Carsonella ruddii HT isolate Thao2000]
MNNINKNILGIWLYLISDCIIFTILFISFLNSNNYFYKNIIYNYRIVLIETILLLICSYLSILIIKKKNIKYCYLNLIFSLLFLIIEFKDIYHLNYINISYKTNNFLSNYFIIIFFHALHVIISILICINLIILKKLKKKFKLINIFFSLFWHFIHIVWLCLIFIIYIKK